MQPTATYLIPFTPTSTAIGVFQEPSTVTDKPTGSPHPGAGTGAAPNGSAVAPQGNASGGASPAPGGMDPTMLLMLGMFVVVMLFMSMRRESKAKKAQQAMLASIKKGDHIVTTAGIHGIVDRLEEQTVVLVLDTIPVTFERAAIARVVRDDASRPEAKRA